MTSDLPSSWSRSTWGDLIELSYGKALAGRKDANGAVPVFGTNGPTGAHASEAQGAGPTIVIGRKGAYRGVTWSPGPFWVIDTAFFVKPKVELNLAWAFRALSAIDINRLDSGSAIPSTRRDDVYALPVALPPLVEQQRIAWVLDSLDDKIQNNSRTVETLEQLAATLFKSWFVDFTPVRAKAEGHDPQLPASLADLFPARLVDSELGQIPDGWRVDVLKNALTELEIGSRPKGGVSGYSEGIPSIGAESIVGLGVFDYAKTKFIPQDFFDRMKKGHVHDRDVLLYKDGGRPGAFEPHVSMFGDDFPFERCAINEHVYRLRAHTEIGQNFLFFWLSSAPVMEEMRLKGTGVAIPGLNSTQVRSLTALIPPREVLGAFDNTVEPWISRLLASCKQSRTLAALRDKLLPKLISGQLRVPPNDEIGAAA